MSSAYGSTVNVPTPTVDLNTLLPLYTRLTDAVADAGAHANAGDAGARANASAGTQVRIVRVDRNDEAQLAQLHAMLNHEIRAGDTYPQEHEMNVEEWGKYFLSAEAFVVVKGGPGEEPGKEVFGTFYIKPNFPGRCSHVSFMDKIKNEKANRLSNNNDKRKICNGGFIVHKDHRKKGVGGVMAKAFLQLAPALGYRASMFNLVFVSNVASIKLWKGLGFQEIGRIPQAGMCIYIYTCRFYFYFLLHVVYCVIIGVLLRCIYV